MIKPNLSICIPTYNRADVLKHCIDAIVNHEQAKKGGIEIVVCDNASTDNTQEMMSEYAQKYPYIIYIRNKENVGVIYNTLNVLDNATGAYRKLLNDYSVFTTEGLQKMYDQIVANQEDRPVLMFDNKKDENSDEQICQSLDEVVRYFGIWLTWMGTYGYWEEDWKSMIEREKYFDKTFCTIDYLIQMYNRKKQIQIYRNHYTDGWSYQRKQGGYNFFKVFVQDYLDLWHIYVENKTIAPSLYRWHKKDIWSFIWMRTRNFMIDKNAGNFKTQEGWKLLFKYYGKEWYFWWTLFKYPFGTVKRKIMKRL